MKLTSTLTRQKELLKPLKQGHIRLYTCGPTVYHFFHIGNLRKAVFDDTLVRALKAYGYTVDHVENITDVGHLSSDADEGEDKLQSRAEEEGKTVWEVAQYYLKAFNSDMKAMNVLQPTKYVRATDAIPTQLKMIEVLMEKGYAYKAAQAIYFDVSKLDDYGKLSGQKLGDKEVGVREDVVTDPEKHNPQDFALWFFTVGHFKDHAMRWESPWGEGFPGWHLECSAIIEQELGETIDIHTGGVDHIGTHHTNEIAQSEAAHDGAPLAHIWLHSEFLLVNERKMSKSLKNTYTLSDITGKGFKPMALRLLYLQSHYRSQQNFTWDALYGASKYLDRLESWADGQFQDGSGTLGDDEFNRLYDQIKLALFDDLNTPKALVHVSELIDTMERSNLMPTAEQVNAIDALLGLRLNERTDIDSQQKVVMAEREAARKAGDYEAADKARSALKDQGIELEDTTEGARWHRFKP